MGMKLFCIFFSSSCGFVLNNSIINGWTATVELCDLWEFRIGELEKKHLSICSNEYGKNRMQVKLSRRVVSHILAWWKFARLLFDGCHTIINPYLISIIKEKDTIFDHTYTHHINEIESGWAGDQKRKKDRERERKRARAKAHVLHRFIVISS